MSVLNDFPGFSRASPSWLPPEMNPTSDGSDVSTGTTLVAMEFDGGVVIGADSRYGQSLTPITSVYISLRSVL